MARGGNRGARTPVDNARRNGRFAVRKPMDRTIHRTAFNPNPPTCQTNQNKTAQWRDGRLRFVANGQRLPPGNKSANQHFAGCIPADCRVDFPASPLSGSATQPSAKGGPNILLRQCSSAVEQRFRKPSVIGSNPIIGSIFFREYSIFQNPTSA